MIVSSYGSHHYVKFVRRRNWLCLATFFFISILLVGCTGGDNAMKGTPTTSAVAPTKLKWCSKPNMVFRDEGSAAASSPTAISAAKPTTTSGTPGATATATTGGAPTTGPTLPPPNGTPSTISDWSVFKANIDFTIYLPATLPAGTCLLSAFGTLRDPIMGSSFTIGYLLANHDSISLSEAPLRSQSPAFQCSVDTRANADNNAAKKNGTPVAGTPTPPPTPQVPLQLCSGAHEKTDIVFSSRGNTNDLESFFNKLKPDVDWIPAS